MIALGILCVAGVAGYAGMPWWFVPLAAAGLTLEGWWDKLLLLRQRPREPWSSKITTYFVTGVLRDLCFAALAYGVGSAVRGLSG